MSVLIELTLVESVNPDEVKKLLIDFLKTSSHLFKSFNIRYLDVGGSDSFENKLFNLTEEPEDLDCTTCCMEDTVEPIVMNFDTNLISGDPDGILFNDRYYTNQELNNTFYMDCENHSNSIVKEEASTFVLKREPSMDVSSLQQLYTKTTSKRKPSLNHNTFYMDCENHSNSIVKEEASTFVLKREPSMDVSSLQQLYTKTTSKRKSLLKELPFFTEQSELNQRKDASTIKVTENCAMVNTTNSDIRCDVSTKPRDALTQPAELLEKSHTKDISLVAQPESFYQNAAVFEEAMGTKENFQLDNGNSKGPTGNLSYDRSTLEEFENNFEEANSTKEDTLDEIDNISSGAVEDSSFDRSSLYESENELEEAEKEEQIVVGSSLQITTDCHKRAVHPGNLVDVLEAAKRGDLTIECNADEAYMNLDGFIVENCSGINDENLLRVYDQLNMNNFSKGKGERVFWKQVKCQSCSSKRFASFEDAIVHVLAVHCDKTLPRIYRCSLCSTTSFYKRNLRKVHLKRKHNIQYWRHHASAKIVEKWHPSTLLEALEASKREFPKIWPIIERFLVWVVKSGRLDTEVSKTP